MNKEFHYAKVTSGEVDEEFGELQVTRSGRNLMSVVMIIVPSILLFKLGKEIIEEFNIYFGEYFHIRYILWSLESNVGTKLAMLAFLIFFGSMLAYGIYCFFFKKISFYQRGFVMGKNRIAYREMKEIKYKRIRGISRTRIYAYNQFSIVTQDPKKGVLISTNEYRWLTDVMSEFCRQFSDIYSE